VLILTTDHSCWATAGSTAICVMLMFKYQLSKFINGSTGCLLERVFRSPLELILSDLAPILFLLMLSSSPLYLFVSKMYTITMGDE